MGLVVEREEAARRPRNGPPLVLGLAVRERHRYASLPRINALSIEALALQSVNFVSAWPKCTPSRLLQDRDRHHHNEAGGCRSAAKLK